MDEESCANGGGDAKGEQEEGHHDDDDEDDDDDDGEGPEEIPVKKGGEGQVVSPLDVVLAEGMEPEHRQ